MDVQHAPDFLLPVRQPGRYFVIIANTGNDIPDQDVYEWVYRDTEHGLERPFWQHNIVVSGDLAHAARLIGEVRKRQARHAAGGRKGRALRTEDAVFQDRHSFPP